MNNTKHSHQHCLCLYKMAEYEEFDSTSGLPVNVFSFMLDLIVPSHHLTGHYDAERKDFITYHKTHTRMFFKKHMQSPRWKSRAMGSVVDGLWIPHSAESGVNKVLHLNSDFDTWIYQPELCVDFIPTRARFIADPTFCSPGYVQILHVVQESIVKSKDDFPHLVTVEAQKYVSADAFSKQVKECVQQGSANPTDISIHGPAVNTDEGLTSKTGRFIYPFDMVPVLISNEWPHLAEEWELRKRPSYHPCVRYMEYFKKLGCDFVPVPSPNSVNPSIEWRIGFSLIEQRLCQLFSTTQRQCFLLAKALLKNQLQTCEAYSTYLLKTAMFWMNENIPSSEWQTENALGRYLLNLLETFQNYLQGQHLPHYFIQERNLIGHHSKNAIDEMMKKLTIIRREPLSYILDSCHLLAPLKRLDHCKEFFIVGCEKLIQHFSISNLCMVKRRLLQYMMFHAMLFSEVELTVNMVLKYMDYKLNLPIQVISSDLKAWTSDQILSFLFETAKFGSDFVQSRNKTEHQYLISRNAGILCVYHFLSNHDDLKADPHIFLEKADHYLQEASSIYPRDLPLSQSLAEAEPYIYRALIHKVMGDYSKALEIIELILENEQFFGKTSPIRFPHELNSLIDNILFWETKHLKITISAHNLVVLIQTQLLVLMDKYAEAGALFEEKMSEEPGTPLGHPEDKVGREYLWKYGYLWLSNFIKAANLNGTLTAVEYGLMYDSSKVNFVVSTLAECQYRAIFSQIWYKFLTRLDLD